MENKSCSANLVKLRELTNNLPTGFPDLLEVYKKLPILISEVDNLVYKEWKVKNGECFSWLIHRSANDVAINRWFLTKGTIFPEHSHITREWIIVYKGSLKYWEEEKGEWKIDPGEFAYTDPGKSHSCVCLEDCKAISVTIPPAKEYTNG